MIKPIEFPESNKTFTAPVGMEDNCEPLRVFDTGDAFISCWKLSWIDRIHLLLTGKVWLWVIGRGHPPVTMETISPFKN